MILNIIEHYKNNHIDCHPSSRCQTDVNYEPSKTIISDSKAELNARFWRERWFTNCQEILSIVWTHIWSSVSITTCFGQTCPFLTGMTMWTAGEWLQWNISLIREIHAIRVLSGGWRTGSTVFGAQCGTGRSTQQFISDEVCVRTFPACVCLHSINTCSAVYR